MKDSIANQGETQKEGELRDEESNKLLVDSVIYYPNESQIEKVEEIGGFFGNATRADSRFFKTCSIPLKISIYRPAELTTGTKCLIRLLRKTIKGGDYHKMVVIPNPLQDISEIPETAIAFLGFLQKCNICPSEISKFIDLE